MKVQGTRSEGTTTTGTAKWHMKCCSSQSKTILWGSAIGWKSNPPVEAEQTSTAFYQGFIGWITSPFQSVHIVVVGRTRLNIYFYHAQSEQWNVSLTHALLFLPISTMESRVS